MKMEKKKIVEIDESVFFKRKYNRGRINSQKWFVGGIERGTNKCFITEVPNRNAETIVRVLLRYVKPGTKIMTDCWPAYKRAFRNLEMDLEHERVNHSLNFVDPENPNIHTQNIESLWSRSKNFLRKKKGISDDQRRNFLIQFLWEQRIKKELREKELIILLNYSNL